MKFVLDMPPVDISANPRHHIAGSNRARYQHALSDAVLMIRDQRNRNRWGTLCGKVTVAVSTHVADERGVDVDACIKATLDALQHGGAIENDRQVALLVARRIVGDGAPRIEVEVTAHG